MNLSLRANPPAEMFPHISQFADYYEELLRFSRPGWHPQGATMKQFNTTGPCRSDIHYMLPAVERLPETRRLIEGQNYFVLHAARQTGKTTSMLALAHELTAEGRYAAIVLSVQTASVFSHDIEAAEKLLLSNWRTVAEDELPPKLRPPAWSPAETGQRINAALRDWARRKGCTS
jgi:hypothetical protein